MSWAATQLKTSVCRLSTASLSKEIIAHENDLRQHCNAFIVDTCKALDNLVCIDINAVAHVGKQERLRLSCAGRLDRFQNSPKELVRVRRIQPPDDYGHASLGLDPCEGAAGSDAEIA